MVSLSKERFLMNSEIDTLINAHEDFADSDEYG
jgi:hypothetical protein